MTGHDLDLEACKRIPHPVAKMLVAEVESLRAKLAAAEQERDDLRIESERLRGLAAEREAQLRYAVAAGETERGHSNDACCSCCYDLNPQRRRAARADAALAAVRAVCAEINNVREYGERGSAFQAGANQLACRIERALAAAEQDENVLPELVGRVQWACSQITDALADSRVIANPATAAWLRTIRDTLANASGDIPVATAEQDEPKHGIGWDGICRDCDKPLWTHGEPKREQS